jgi:L-threonylcarbamoyladenylate synthase
MKPLSENISLFAEAIKHGELVCFPTETVYGLGADATNAEAVVKIYETKERPKINPLIAHYAELSEVEKDVIINDNFLKLAKAFWPAPISFVLKKSDNCRICDVATAGLKTIAVRIPRSEIARELIKKAGVPIVAPSANPSGLLSPVSFEQAKKMLGQRVKYFLDGGECEVGVESTIIDLTSEMPTILRFGAITKEQIEEIIGKVNIATKEENSPKAPGMLLRHYRPKCGLRLTQNNPIENEALLWFGTVTPPNGFSVVKNLSIKGDINEAAKNLFNFLHTLEELGVSRISAILVPEIGIGIAINDKLKRAAE